MLSTAPSISGLDLLTDLGRLDMLAYTPEIKEDTFIRTLLQQLRRYWHHRSDEDPTVDFHDELPTQFPHFPGARDLFADDEDARVSTAELNAGLQIGYVIIGIRAAGLAAGPMTGFDADAISKEFFPDGRHRVLVAINIGKPAEEGAWFDRLPRLAYDEVVTTL